MAENQRFEIDGVVYESIDDVPPAFRDSIAALMADHDANGVPDVFEGGITTRSTVHRTASYEIDGVAYESIDDIPEPQRSQVRQALARADLHAPTPPAPVARSVPSPTAPHSPIVRSAGWSSRTKLLVAFVAVDLIALAVIAWLALR